MTVDKNFLTALEREAKRLLEPPRRTADDARERYQAELGLSSLLTPAVVIELVAMARYYLETA